MDDADARHDIVAPASFRRLQELRMQPHRGRWRGEVAFVSGHCHDLAIALQERIGGRILMLSTIKDPGQATHFGVQIGDRVSDVEGHHPIGEWHAGWSKKFDRNAVMSPVTNAQVVELMEMWNPITQDRIEAARPMAEALADTLDLPQTAWRVGTDRMIVEDEDLPKDADEAWRKAIGSEDPRPVSDTAVLPPFTQEELFPHLIPKELRFVDAHGAIRRRDAEHAGPMGIVAQAKEAASSGGPRDVASRKPAVQERRPASAMREDGCTR